MRIAVSAIFATALAACSGSPPRPPPPEPLAEARQIHELAIETFEAGRYRDALAGFDAAERRFLGLDDARGVAAAAISQAEIHLLLGETGAAKAVLRRTSAALGRSEDASLRTRAQLLSARLATHDDPGTSRRLLATLQEETPAIAAQARLLACELEMREGNSQCAATLVANDAATSARILQLQARAAVANGDASAASPLLDAALNIHRARAFRPGIAAVHAEQAKLALYSGDRALAVKHLERALYLRLWIRDRVHSMEILRQLAKLAPGEVTRERYRRWQAWMQDESREPDWDEMMATLFSSR